VLLLPPGPDAPGRQKHPHTPDFAGQAIALLQRWQVLFHASASQLEELLRLASVDSQELDVDILARPEPLHAPLTDTDLASDVSCARALAAAITETARHLLGLWNKATAAVAFNTKAIQHLNARQDRLARQFLQLGVFHEPKALLPAEDDYGVGPARAPHTGGGAGHLVT
jgi:hypothetical protein